MVINQKKEIEYIQDGENVETFEMEVDKESIHLLATFFSEKIYSDSIGSAIRETVSNSVDATVKAGNKEPVIVKLEQNNGQWQFTSEDKGIGLDKEDIDKIIKKYLKSTKRQDNNQIGGLGLGFKSPLAYKDYFQFQCRKDGKEILCIMRKGDPMPKIDIVYEKDTTESNGVKVIIDVDYYDRREFSQKIRTQLIYFNNVYVIDNYDKYDNEYKIYKNDLFSYSKICSDDYLHLNFAGIYYPLDFDKLGIKRIQVPIAINIGLEDGIEPAISRENIRYTIEAKEFILNKIKLIAEWFVNEYNKDVKEFNSFTEAKPYIDSSGYYVKLGEKDIKIDDITSYSSIPFSNITVKGYNNTDLKLLSNKYGKILDTFESVAEIDYGGRLNTKNVSRSIEYVTNPILVNSTPVGNMREYLKDKYSRNRKFFKMKRPFTLKKTYYSNYDNWIHALNLSDKPKNTWRLLIQDALRIQQEWIAKCDDQRNLEIPKEWLEARKQKRAYEGKLLNKQDGEITYFFTRNKEYGGQMFDKKTVKISSLGKEKKMIIYFTPQEKEVALQKWEQIFYPLNKKYVEIVLINSREKKHVKNLQNYKTWKEYMETNQFKKIATKMLAKKVESRYQNILRTKEFSTIMETVASNKKDVMDRINTYIQDVYGSVSEYALEDLLKTCEENNLWDMGILSDIKEMEKLAKQFEFINFMQIPSRYAEEESKKKFAKYVAQYILFNKLYKNDFEQFEICVKAPLEENVIVNEGEIIPENLIEA